MNSYRTQSRARRRVSALRVVAISTSALLGVAIAPMPAFAVTPLDGGAFTIFPVTINASVGDQYDPHVSGDIVSYTFGRSASPLHFYDFFSGVDSAVPSWPDSEDQLSDTSSGRIVFTRIDEITGNLAIRIYDTASQTLGEVDALSALHPSDSSIGSDTVAFISDVAVAGELVVSRLGSTTQQVTSDTRYDQQTAVAPLGDFVVYESCAQSPGNCDIHQAAWIGSTWVESDLTTTTDPEANPDTDGTFVVYDAVRSGERDVCWQPVGGGTEQCLALAGEQRDPSIAAGVIIYEDVVGMAPDGSPSGDLFAYEIATNRRFRITSTPTDESLSDIASLGGGRFRIAWTSSPTGVVGDRDVYGATIELPTVGPRYTFGGFLAPVDPRPTLNSMKGGAAVPVKFSLGGNQGTNIFAPGYPKSQVIACDSTANVDGIETTVNAGGSSLAYDPASGLYSYVWKTDKVWAGTCRQLVLGLADGSFQRANFKFK